jgi:hypothetical protein
MPAYGDPDGYSRTTFTKCGDELMVWDVARRIKDVTCVPCLATMMDELFRGVPE